MFDGILAPDLKLDYVLIPILFTCLHGYYELKCAIYPNTQP